jgi:hypothetical protein
MRIFLYLEIRGMITEYLNVTRGLFPNLVFTI